MAEDSKRYDAFISYSHAADGELAPAVQRGLQRLAKPWRSRRALEVFRDQTGLAANPDLWTSITTAMDGSEWFVLLSSPEAATSEWVGKEIQRWVVSRGPDRILPVVTDGTFVWDPQRGDIDFSRSTAAHYALAGVFRAEPRHIDMTWARSDTDLTLRNPRFRDQIAEIAAPMHGTTKDELEGEDIRQQRRTSRLVRSAVVGMAALTVIAVLGAVLAIVNGREAERQRAAAREAEAEAIDLARSTQGQRLADLSGDARRPLDGLLAAQAHRMDPSPQATAAMVAALVDSNGLVVHLGGHEEAVPELAYSPDGAHIATVDAGGTVRTFDSEGGPSSPPLPLDATGIAFVDRGVLAVGTPEGLAFVRVDSDGEPDLARFDSPITAVGRLGGSDRAVVGTESGTVAVVDGDGEVLSSTEGAHDHPVRFVGSSEDGATLVTFSSPQWSSPFVWDQPGGEVLVHDPTDLAVKGRWEAAGPVLAISPDGSELALRPSGSQRGAQIDDRGGQVVELRHTGDGGPVDAFWSREMHRGVAAAFTADGSELVILTGPGADGGPALAVVAPPGSDVSPYGSVDVRQLGHDSRTLRSVSIHPDGGRVAIGTSSPEAFVVDVEPNLFGSPVEMDGASAAVPLSIAGAAELVAVRGSGPGSRSTVGVASLDGSDVRLVASSTDGRVSLSPDGGRLLTSHGLFDVATGDPVGDDVAPAELRLPASWSADGTRVAYLVADGRGRNVVVVDARTGELLGEVGDVAEGPGVELCETGSVAVSGDPYITCGTDSTLLDLSPDGSLLSLRGRQVGPDSGTEGYVVDISGDAPDGWSVLGSYTTLAGGSSTFSADGEEVVVRSGDVVQRHVARTLEPIGGPLSSDLEGVWRREGDLLATVGACGVIITDPATLRSVAEIPVDVEWLEGGCAERVDAAWVPGTSELLVARDDCDSECPLHRWDLDGDRLAEELCARAGRNLTLAEWEQFSPGWDYEATCSRWARGDGETFDPARDDAAEADPPTTDPGEGSDSAEEDVATTTTSSTHGAAGSEGAARDPGEAGDGGDGGGEGDDGETYATIDAYRESFRDDPDHLYVGDCELTRSTASNALCTARWDRSGDDVVVFVGYAGSDLVAAMRLQGGDGAWTVTDSHDLAEGAAPPAWLEGWE